MGQRRVEALLNPPLLVWAREQAGFSVPEAARASRLPVARLRDWEQGGGRPTMKQARDLAALYGQPLGNLYLDHPPAVPPMPADFRGRIEGEPYSAALLREMRRARSIRDAAVDLSLEIDHPFPEIDLALTPDLDIETAAQQVRAWLEAPVGLDRPWKNANEAFSWWRRRIESKGVLVVVARHVPGKEMSGFTFAADGVPVIALNGADPMARRVFSLLHELVHVILRQDSVSDLLSQPTAKIEQFCNKVAARVLIPTADLRAHHLVIATGGRTRAWDPAELRTLATDFGTSVQAAYIRLLDEQLATRAAYTRWIDEGSGGGNRQEREKGKSGPSYYTLKIHDLGRPFIERVYEAFHAEAISLASVCDLLGVKADVARKLETRFAEFVLRAG